MNNKVKKIELPPQAEEALKNLLKAKEEMRIRIISERDRHMEKTNAAKPEKPTV